MAAADTLLVQVMPCRQDPVPPMPDRVDALPAEMTVVGKVAQLGSRWVGNCLGRVTEGGDGQAGSLQVALWRVHRTRSHADRRRCRGRGPRRHIPGRARRRVAVRLTGSTCTAGPTGGSPHRWT
jgi:hypothetical protein